MPDITTMKGIEQKRADYAYNCALEAKSSQERALVGNDFYKSKNYKSYSKKIPMQIKTNGLGPTFAFILSKTVKEKKGVPAGQRENPKNAYDLLYKQIADWISTKYPFSGDLSHFIITQDSSEYRAITVETLALFNWLRRFAEGLIEGEEDSNNDD